MKTLKKPGSTGRSTKKKERIVSQPYDEVFQKELLVDQSFAAGYMTSALDEGVDTFLIAINRVVKSKCGMSALAKASNLNRENLYDMLSEGGNPRLSSLVSVLDALGFKIEIQPKDSGKKK